jgi:2'-5' RNA ligase
VTKNGRRPLTCPNQQSRSLRLFIAARLPEEIKSALAEAQARLRSPLREAPVRWTRRDQLHLTLRFLGNVQPQQVEALIAAGQRACREFAPLRLRAAAVGFFPNDRFPRVIWAGARDSEDRLALLQRAVQEATQQFCSEPPDHRFIGHVTLGRIKDLKRAETVALVRAASALAHGCFGEWIATELELMRSELSSTGAEHAPLANFPLGVIPG